MAKISLNHPVLRRVMEDEETSPDVFRTINITIADMIHALNVCCEMEILWQIFFQPPPSFRKKALDNTDNDKSNKKAKANI
eukprot:15363598-Ditylum_brightwellii.AAC.1